MFDMLKQAFVPHFIKSPYSTNLMEAMKECRPPVHALDEK